MLHCGTTQAGSLRETPDWMAYTASLVWKQDMVRVPTVGMFALQRRIVVTEDMHAACLKGLTAVVRAE